MNEEREINEIGYAIVEEKKLNNKLVINKGKYISIYEKVLLEKNQPLVF